MIVTASDSQESFDSINQWLDLYRKTRATAPIYLVLVTKSQDASEHIVTETMLQQKCEEENFAGVITLNNKDMDHEEYCKIFDSAVEQLYIKAQECWVDIRGLM